MDGKKTVLIAEDDSAYRTLLSDAFTDAGYDVAVAEDGEQALTVAKEKKPDFLLLDIKMPKEGGIQVMKKLRGDPWGAKVPIFVLTNMGDMETIASAVENVAAGYFVKSDHSMGDIVRSVEAYISKS